MANQNQKTVGSWLNTLGVLLATSCLTPLSAFGACSPSPVSSGDTVVCSGPTTDTAGIGNNSQSDVTVTVDAGAIVRNDNTTAGVDNTIALVSNNNLTINGRVEGELGIFLGGFDNVLQIGPDGQIDVSNTGVYANNTKLVNEGSIDSQFIGVEIGGDSSLTNDGVIAVKGFSARGLEVGPGVTVVNNGTITAEDDSLSAIHLNANTVVINNGLIDSRSFHSSGNASAIIDFGGANTVENNKTINVEAWDTATGINLNSGVVKNTGNLTVLSSHGDARGVVTTYGLNADNSGTISVTGVDSAVGIQASYFASHIVNSGNITAYAPGGSVGISLGGKDSTIENSGTIKADNAIEAYQSVKIINSGTINGGIRLSDDADILMNLNDGRIAGVENIGGGVFGGIDMGKGDDILINLGSINSPIRLGDGDDYVLAQAGVTNSAAGLAKGGDGFDSVGVYSNAVEGGVLELWAGFEGVAVYADDDSVFTIDAKSGADSDLYVTLLGSGVVINKANLTAFTSSRPGVLMRGDGLEFRNEGTLDGVTGVGIEGTAQTFVNKGTIAALNDGVSASDGHQIENAKGAVITAVDASIDAGSNNVIVNDGVLNSTKGAALVIGDQNDISNTGVINAKSDGGIGILAGNPNDVFGTDDHNKIANSGDITAVLAGIVVADSNDVINSGKIEASITGISLGDYNTLTNSGSITAGAGGQAVLAGSGNIVTNNAEIFSGGVGVKIDGGSAVVNAGTIIAEGDAVQAGSADTEFDLNIYNSGTLEGVNAFHGGVEKDNVQNSGILNGNVLLGDGDDTMTLLGGSTIVGDIDAGSGADKVTSSGAGSIDGRVTNLEQLTVTDGTLAMNLTGGSDIGQTAVNGGVLELKGGVATAVSVASGGTLSGTASIVGSVQNAGSVAPGSSIGTLSIQGNYSQSASGILAADLGPLTGDLLDISGKAVLSGGVMTGLQGDDFAGLEGKSFTILTANGGVSGTLDTTGSVQQGFWTVNISQTSNDVRVTITDVTVPLGAMNTSRNVLAGAVNAATPVPQGNGVVIQGDTNTLPAVEQRSQSLSYDSMGDWETKAASFTDNWSTLGDRTPATSMPKTGTAEFAGTTKGELSEIASGTPEVFVVEGNVLLTANFASGLVNADFTDMEKIDAHGVAAAWVDFRARMSIADGTSEFAGTAGTDDGVWSGKAKGGFYGDDNGMPGHAAGLWSMSSPLGRALGGFMAKRQ
jgi:hypothetical protein